MSTRSNVSLVGSWLGLWVVVAALGVCIGSVSPSPAQASYSLDRAKVRSYAKKYSCNGADCRNKNYVDFGDYDCTNFVSQALRYGGMPMTKNRFSPDWYYTSRSEQGLAWVNVTAFDAYMDVWPQRAVIKIPKKMSDRYSPADASAGDVYMYDWGKGWGYTHLSVSTGYGKFGSYWDAHFKKNYNTTTGGYGDKMAQHSTDRDGAPWNWGYWNERNEKRQKKMRTVVIHFDPSM